MKTPWARKLLKIVLLNAAILGGLAAHRSYEQHRTAETLAIRGVNGIDDGRFITINGVDQWVRIRGEDRNNPVILFLHGGPGAASSLFAWQYYARQGWEKSFTMVHWDQPGAGRTFTQAANKIDPSLTQYRMACDGIEVAEFVRRELHKEKIILVGTSWGSALGVRMTKLRPDLFSAYVGSAQVTNKEQDEVLAYQQVLAKARKFKHSSAIAELEASGPPPYATTQPMHTQRKWARHFEGLPGNMTTLLRAIYTPNVSLSDFLNWVAALEASEAHFRGATATDGWNRFDIHTFGTDFAVPVFFFQGTEDDIAPLANVQTYFDWIHAPQKKMVVIKDGGHNASLMKGDAFLGLLNEHVRALAVGAGRLPE